MASTWITFFIGVALGYSIGYLVGRMNRTDNASTSVDASDGETKEKSGISIAEANMQRIRALFDERDAVAPADVAELLGVPPEDARSYLDTLCQRDEIEQHGDEERGVFFMKKGREKSLH